MRQTACTIRYLCGSPEGRHFEVISRYFISFIINLSTLTFERFQKCCNIYFTAIHLRKIQKYYIKTVNMLNICLIMRNWNLGIGKFKEQYRVNTSKLRAKKFADNV